MALQQHIMDMGGTRGKQRPQPAGVFVQNRRKKSRGGSRVDDFLRVGVDGGGGDIRGQHQALSVQDQTALGGQQAFADPVRIGLTLKIRMPGRLEIHQTPGQQYI